MARAPLVLIVSEHEWASRSLDTILAPRGYAVLRAYNRKQAIERAIEADPHAIFIDRSLPDASGIEVCQELHEDERFSNVTPLILMTSGPVSHDQRLEALRAGAWELLSFPVDVEELLLRLERYIRAKIEADQARDDTLVDANTGFYSRQGTFKRIQELGAAAQRSGRPIACVFVSAQDISEATGDDRVTIEEMARLLRRLTRKSDVLGRIGPHDFAVVAPDTPPEGAQTLADRIRQRAVDGTRMGPRTGAYGLRDVPDRDFNPVEFVNQAARASKKVQPPHQN